MSAHQQSTADMKSVRARKDGAAYLSLSGYYWQEWLVAMEDGSVRRAAVGASGPGSGPRAARRNAEGNGPWRLPDQEPYKETARRRRAEEGMTS